jgi:hypothetical protein
MKLMIELGYRKLKRGQNVIAKIKKTDSSSKKFVDFKFDSDKFKKNKKEEKQPDSSFLILDQNNLIFKDLSLKTLKIETETGFSFDHDYHTTRPGQNASLKIILHIEFTNHDDAEFFLEKLYEKKVYKYWAKTSLFSNTVEIRGFYSETLNTVLEESKQFTIALEQLINDYSHLSPIIREFVDNNPIFKSLK